LPALASWPGLARFLGSLRGTPAPRPRRRSRFTIPPELASEIRGSLDRWGALWSLPGLAEGVTVQFSSRFRSSLGSCSPRSGAIRISTAILQFAPEILEEVLCHEAAHAAVAQLHPGRVRPHGREWAELMRAAGYEPRVRFPIRLPRHP
jgi:hypothetical protein